MIPTPVCDFVHAYANKKTARFHMPGHKGVPHLGPEPLDLTEIAGADVLYQESGILKESQDNAATLFGSAKTLYSCEGSSLSIRAMLYLALIRWKKRGGNGRPLLLAARNAHKVLIYAAACLDLDIEWIFPDEPGSHLSSVQPSPEKIRRILSSHSESLLGLYLTSPDYLGKTADLQAIGQLCRERDLPLLIDNAHGAYLHFLPRPLHPMDLGAYLCTDSAHKTLPCLTGTGYLHLSEEALAEVGDMAPKAMSLFASTSPSYLLLQSLDLANAYLSSSFREELSRLLPILEAMKERLSQSGVPLLETEPLKLTLGLDRAGILASDLGPLLRRAGIEPEYEDPSFTVFMISPFTSTSDLLLLEKTLTDLFVKSDREEKKIHRPPLSAPLSKMSIRQALFSPQEILPIRDCAGRICASPTVSCPPAIPIAVSGELIDEATLRLLSFYGIEELCVVCE